MGLLNVLTLSLLVYVGLKWDIFRRLLLGLEVSAFQRSCLPACSYYDLLLLKEMALV